MVQDSHRLHSHYVQILEKDDKVTVGISMLYFFRTLLNAANIANVSFANHLLSII